MIAHKTTTKHLDSNLNPLVSKGNTGIKLLTKTNINLEIHKIKYNRFRRSALEVIIQIETLFNEQPIKGF